MSRWLTLSQALIGMGLVLALAAALVGGPGWLTLFLSVGQVALLLGVLIYVLVVVQEFREKGVL